MVDTYGHRQFSLFFRPVVEVDENGFLFKSRNYDWNAIESIDVDDSPFKFFLGYPATIARATIALKDGKYIRLNARVLEKKGEKPNVSFLSGKSDAFVQLIKIFRQHATYTA